MLNSSRVILLINW